MRWVVGMISDSLTRFMTVIAKLTDRHLNSVFSECSYVSVYQSHTMRLMLDLYLCTE